MIGWWRERGAWICAAGMAVSGAAAAQGSVTTVTVNLTKKGVALRIDGGGEPVLDWSGAGKVLPYRLSLIWDAPALAPTGALPVVPVGGMGPIRALAWVSTSTGTRLEALVGQNVAPHLRRVGGTWLLELDAEPEAESSTQTPTSPARVVATRGIAPPPSNPPGAIAPGTLLVDVDINGIALSGIVSARRLGDGRLMLPESAWDEARLRRPGQFVDLDGERAYAVDGAAGLSYQMDMAHLVLHLQARPEAFLDTQVTLTDRGPGAPPSPPAGIYGNYDVSASSTEGRTSYGGIAEAIAFNQWGSLSNSMAFTREPGVSRLVRTETIARRDFPSTMESLIVGDAISSAGTWSRPVRYGGVRFARDFAVAPGYITTPMPTISGSAALPATLDVLVNGRRQATTNVPSGPFALTNIPVVTGAGELNVIIRDVQGSEKVITQGYYVAQTLLAPGLSDFSLEAGSLRMNFGTESNDYRSPFVSGSYRAGLNDSLTAGGRAELQGSRQALGVDGVALLHGYAVAHAAAAWSRSVDPEGSGPRTGLHWTLGLERIAPSGGMSLGMQHFAQGFRQFASVPGERLPRDSIQVGGGARLNETLNAGMSAAKQTTWEGDSSSVLGFSVGMKLSSSAFLSLYASRLSGATPGWSVGLSLVVPLDHGRTLSASSSFVQGAFRANVSGTQAAPQGPGWGWAVRSGNVPGQTAQASVILNTNAAQLQADANAGNGNNAMRVTANGSVGWLDSTPFASRRIDEGAFAVVRVGQIAGVAVSRSNQVAAVTNSDGVAVVTGLLPYQANQITVNAEDFPLDVQVNGVKEIVLPYARSGVVVDMPVRRARNVLVVLHGADGAPVPAGSKVRLSPGKQEFVVAKRGEVYLTDVLSRQMLEVHGGGAPCSVMLELEPSVPPEAHVGPLKCVPSR